MKKTIRKVKRKVALLAALLALVLSITGVTAVAAETWKSAVEKEVSKEQKKSDKEKSDKEKVGEIKKEATIKKKVLFDEKDIKITALSLSYGKSSAELEVRLENNTEKDLTFASEAMGAAYNAINDTMIMDGYLNEDVAAGKSVTATIEFGYDNMFLFGISEIGTIQVGFAASDDQYNLIRTGPLELKTTAAKSVKKSEKTSTDSFRKRMQNKKVQENYGFEMKYYSEDEVYSSSKYSIITELLLENKRGSRSFMLETKNGTKKNAYVTCRDITVNDKMIHEGSWADNTLITAKKRALVRIDIDGLLDREENKDLNIKDIKSIGFTVEIQDNYGKDLAEPEEVLIKVK